MVWRTPFCFLFLWTRFQYCHLMSPVLILEGTTNNLPSSRPLLHRLLSSSLSQAYLAIPAWHESCSIFLLFCEPYGIWFATAEHWADIPVEKSAITLRSYSWVAVSSKFVIQCVKSRFFFFLMHIIWCLTTLNFTAVFAHHSIP